MNAVKEAAEDPAVRQALLDPYLLSPRENTLDDAKLPVAWVPERLGGSGASLVEGFTILGVAGLAVA
jgi:hypothetical protein